MPGEGKMNVEYILQAYKRGLEDAFEMILSKCKTNDIEELKACIEKLLSLLKEQKINEINDMIHNRP